MIRVLHVLAALNDGGVESMLKSYYELFDQESIKFDFIVFEKEKGMFEDYFLSKGSKIYHITPKKENFIKSNKELKRIIKQGNYDIIHCHQNRSNVFPLHYARKYKINNRISHSHAFVQIKSLKEKIAKNIYSYIIEKNATKLYACSSLAAEWLYSKKNKDKVVIINNAINLKKFKYDSNIRKEIREKYNLSKKIVIGCVARLHYQKNHLFLIDIYNELHNINNNYTLFLVGSGTEEEKIKNKVKKLNLEDNVIFAGNCNNVNELLQSFDIFVLPTTSEGLGISLIESQVSGLTTITSENIVPKETNVTPNIHYISLEKTAREWAEEIDLIYKDRNRRKDYIEEISKKGFDIIQEAHKLENNYKEMVRNNE